MVIFISSHNPTFVAIFNDKGRKLPVGGINLVHT